MMREILNYSVSEYVRSSGGNDSLVTKWSEIVAKQPDPLTISPKLVIKIVESQRKAAENSVNIRSVNVNSW